MSKLWAELTSNLESVSTERLLALYLLRFKEAVDKGDTETGEQVARDCEPILAEARRRDAELARLAALKPLERTALEFSIGWATDLALHRTAREYANQYKPSTENKRA